MFDFYTIFTVVIPPIHESGVNSTSNQAYKTQPTPHSTSHYTDEKRRETRSLQGAVESNKSSHILSCFWVNSVTEFSLSLSHFLSFSHIQNRKKKKMKLLSCCFFCCCSCLFQQNQYYYCQLIFFYIQHYFKLYFQLLGVFL